MSFARKNNTAMNLLLWILQILLAMVFSYSGINKSIYSERALVAKGQTGVEGLPTGLIRFIGIAEILGSIGILLPCLINVFPLLTPVSALCLALIMVPAAIIHYKRIPKSKKEGNNVITNIVLFVMCLIVAYGRLKP